jgi:DNA-binding CsgD family transcriptional regulator
LAVGVGVGVDVGVRVERTRRAVERACSTADTADGLLEALDAEVRRAVPHDASIWFGLDPITMLATAPSRVEGMDASLCDTFWHLEFHEQDSGLFTDLARGEGASALQLALEGRTGRSARYRECLVPQGYADELRAVFQSGDATWGAMALYREGSHSAFDSDDLAVIRAISPVVADALRVHVRRAVPWLEPNAPGLVVIDDDGSIVSANHEAVDWLRLLWPMTSDGDGRDVNPTALLDLRDRSVGVPTPLFALVAKARAVADGRERGPARLRVRDERGRWIVLHASALSGPDSESQVALMIEAAKSAEVAPLIIDAYSLTTREREVLGAIARGASTAEIAAELFLSSHTVRDHVKAVFEKVGVSSRGELVARLFAEHYTDGLHARMVHVS